MADVANGGGLIPTRRGIRRVAALNAAIALVFVATKLAVASAMGSVALLGSALDSGVDAAASILTLAAVTVASRPPDEAHPWGHGRAENLAAFAQSVVLIVLACGIGVTAISRLSAGGPDVTGVAILVVNADLVVGAGRALLLRSKSRRAKSAALGADAVNAAGDAASAAAVLIGLVATHRGVQYADSVAALVVVVLVILAALRLGSRAVNVLMDRSDPDLEGKLTEAVTGVQGVVGVDSVNVRTSGADSHADIVVQVERTSSVQEVDELRNRVASVARETGPILSVNVTPQGVADLSKPAAAAFAAANRLGIADQVHNVLAIDHPEGRWLMLHAKVDPVTSLGDAHELTDALERELRLEIADLARVEIHLEPREPEALSGEVVSTSETDLARRATKAALGHPPITGCHEVAVSAVEGRLHVVLHCDAPANVAIGEIHSAASDIERILHASDARVETVTIHFEPRRDERG